MKKFRKTHILQILKNYQNYPIDFFLKNYFKSHKNIGANDRRYICEKVYKIIRHKGLIDYFLSSPITWEKRLDILKDLDIEKKAQNKTVPYHIRVSFPKDYFEKIKKNYKEKALEICFICNTKAPTTIRINPLKTTRDELFNKWKNIYDISKCKTSLFGIMFHKKINFFAMEEFKKGLFEIQDEGSQIVSEFIEVKPKTQVLDYCSGSGGKTLAFAYKMKNTGQIYIYDIRPSILINAKKRFKRASLENFQILNPSSNKKMDTIILDVPCSGSGTLRRNPDMKWKFKINTLENLITTQRNIFKNSFKFSKNNTDIFYITCSIFPDENEKQLDYFLKNYPIKLIKKISFLPKINGKDGFFAAHFKKLF